MAENNSPGYIESVGSSKKKSKEKLRIDQLIPSEILENSGETGIKLLLEKYYEFMNMDEFIYQTTDTYNDIILDKQAVFRISDPRNTNTSFFTDESGSNSTLVITEVNGSLTTIPLTITNVTISNGNELPGTLSTSTSEVGKTFTVSGLNTHNTKSAVLTTITKHWVGPGPSNVMNRIEESMDIDQADSVFLNLIQKEIASSIPRSLSVDKTTLYKSIIDFYKVRGSSDSIQTFFRLLFNDEVTVTRPYDNTLIPSGGDWNTSTGQFVSSKGFISQKANKLHDNDRFQKYSYLIKTGKNLTDWEHVFNRLVHPAGFKFFGEILLFLELVREKFSDSTKGTTVLTKNPETGLLVEQLINVYNRTAAFRKTLSSMPGIQPGALGAEDIPLLVQIIASVFTPTANVNIFKNAILSPVINSSNVITSVQIINPGFGYPDTPAVNVTGAGSGCSLTAVMNAAGSIDSVTVNSGGSSYTTAGISVVSTGNTTAGVTHANSVGKISTIDFPGLANKTYRKAPNLIIGVPNGRDADGVLLASNVQATATFNLEPASLDNIYIVNTGSGYTSTPAVTISGNATGEATINGLGQVDGIRLLTSGSGYTSPPTITISGGGGSNATAEAYLQAAEITTINITNRGNGYSTDPTITLGSSAVSERRAKDIKMILNILFDTSPQTNNYFNLKGNSYFNSTKKFDINQPIEVFGSQTIENTNTSSINTNNVNSFITTQ